MLKRIFIFLCILPFVLLPLLSIDAGISADEPVHYVQAENVYRYFATHGEDLTAINTPITFLKYYGQSIDNFSYLVNRFLGLDEPYLTRHLINALAGALTVLFTGLLAMELAGYGAGILAIIFLLLSPVFLGHTYNNLKDIPFALGYLVSVFYLLKWIRLLPEIRYRYLAGIALGAGFAMSVRIGGLVLIPIIVTFTLWQAWVRRPTEKPALRKYALVGIVALGITLLLASAAGILNWPYGLQSPVRHSLESLKQMTHYIVNIRQLFEGEIYWSQSLPWYYAPKYFLLVSPAIILAGIPLCVPLYKKLGLIVFSLIVFCAFFPLFWVVLLHSNLYGNIRHLLFIYPFLVILSACGWVLWYRRIKKPVWKWALTGVLLLGLAGPLIHIIRNHPVEYVYFNRISGGVKHAYSLYETDYYFNSLGPGVQWLEKNVLTKPGADTLVIASNFPVDPFFEKRFPRIQTVYTPWQERGKYNWDYGLFVNAYLGSAGLKGQKINPGDIVHSINVDGLPMCLILHRTDKRDYQGFRLFEDGRFDQAAATLAAVTKEDPGNETAWLYLGWSLRRLNNPAASNQAAEQLLKIHEGSEQARELMIWNDLDTRKFEEALRLSEELERYNPYFEPAKTLVKAARDSLAGLK